MLILCQSSKRQLINTLVFFSLKGCILTSQNDKFDHAVDVWAAGFDLACRKPVNFHLHYLPNVGYTKCSPAFFNSQSSETYEFLPKFQKILSLFWNCAFLHLQGAHILLFFQLKMILVCCLDNIKVIFFFPYS